MALLIAAATLVLATPDLAKWQGRSVYFVVTDRFARDSDADSSSGGLDHCGNGTKEWCGGTLKGVLSKLDYIHGMGFDALWVTPVVKQVPWRDHWNGTGYHGYWAADFNAIDPHLGSEADLKALSAGCAARGMLFMLDVVVNHVGPISTVEQLGLLGPGLNSTAGQQIHTLERAQNQTLQSYIDHPVQMNQAGDKPFGSGAPGVCWPNYSFGGGCNLTVIQDGWFGDLADLRQEDPSVASYLLDWIRTMVTKYNVDGIRLDTVSYVPKWFLTKFQAAADVYIVGEVVTLNHSMHRSFATPEGPLTGLLNFPVVERFQGPEIWGKGALNPQFPPEGSTDMENFRALLTAQKQQAYTHPHLLGNFVDNHDGNRFLYKQDQDETIVRNGLTWTLLYHGLPIVYYGTEQPEIAGLVDQRTAMWPNYSNETAMYIWLSKMNALRVQHGLAHGGADALSLASVINVVPAEKHRLIFVRGSLLVLLSNKGNRTGLSTEVNLDQDQQRHGNPPHTVLSCMPVADLGARWAHVCTLPVLACNGVEVALGGRKDTCSCRDDKPQVCFGSEGGEPVVFAMSE